MKKDLSVIILSAGKGTRMKSEISKPLHKIGGLEMINHVIKTAKKLDTKEIVIVVSEENKDQIESKISSNIKTIVQCDRNGTGGAAKIGMQKIENKDNNILIMCGDVPLIKFETYQKMIEMVNDENVITILGFYTSSSLNRYGRLQLSDNGEFERIKEFKDCTENERKNILCNAGIVVARGELLNKFLNELNNNNASGEYYLTDIIEIAKNYGYKCNFSMANEDEVMGVNSREELSVAEKIFQDMKRKEFMKNGVTLIDPESIYFSHDTKIENDVIIEPNVVFLEGVNIHKNVSIKSFSYLEGCEIMSGANIGPFARIRPNSIIEENARVGNFCEIKKSILHKGVKVSHLTYVGDADIGENTNIGAGTITCNYDGYSKFKTRIGANSFIGSNTIMVAPIELGENSLTGAGSIITKNVEKDTIAIARAEQKNIVGATIKYRNKKGSNIL